MKGGDAKFSPMKGGNRTSRNMGDQSDTYSLATGSPSKSVMPSIFGGIS